MMIKLKNVSKFYASKGMVASGISKISLEFNVGEFIVITGESGSGKSTLLNVISGLDSYEEGEMYINGLETSHYSELDYEDYRRKYVGNVYQNFNLITSYTVYENIELSLLLNGYKGSDIKDKVNELIKVVNLTKFAKIKVSKLSGGQKQRVSIARALAKNSPIIIADEPTGNLDSKSAKEVLSVLHSISKDRLVVVVTHNYEQLEEYATRKIRMNDGKVLEDKVIKKVESKNIVDVNVNSITFFEKVRLMFRNTFNIIPKFVLLLFIFLFMTTAILSKFGLDRQDEVLSNQKGENWQLRDLDPTRVMFTKEDGSTISDSEFDSLLSIDYVDRVFPNDILLDSGLEMEFSEHSAYLSAIPNNISEFDGELDYGSMPSNDREIIIEAPDYYFSDPSLLIGQSFSTYSNMSSLVEDLVVSGIKIIEPSYSYYDTNVYASESALLDISILFASYDSKGLEVKIDNQDSFNYNYVSEDDDVPVGEVYVTSSYCNNCLNKNLVITNGDITKTFKITKIFKIETGADTYQSEIKINSDDLVLLYYLNGEYDQGSLFVDNVDNIDIVQDELKSMGYDSIAVVDTLYSYDGNDLMEVFNNLVTLGMIVLLFFICYFVIKLILKSRNIYYTTIRMLGASKGVAKKLLIGELFIVASIAYLLFMVVINLIDFSLFNIITEYLNISHFIGLYIVIILMSYLISIRFASKLFKKSIITTLGEEV